MYTYLVIDPKSKTFYVGSSNSTNRPKRHLDGRSCNQRLSRITAKRNVFVFVSEDDGLDTRDEEQFYLNFYFGSRWCLNASNTAAGGDGHGAFSRYNKTEIAQERRRKGGSAIRRGHAKSTHPHSGFEDSEQHRQRVSESHNRRKADDPDYTEKMRRAQRGCVLSKTGYNGVFPPSKEHRLCLSADFVHYYTHFGKWLQQTEI